MTGAATKSRGGLTVAIINPHNDQPYMSDASGNMVLVPGSLSGVTEYAAEFWASITNNTSLRYNLTLELNGRALNRTPFRVAGFHQIYGHNVWKIGAEELGVTSLVATLNGNYNANRSRLMNDYAYTTDAIGLVTVVLAPEMQDPSLARALAPSLSRTGPGDAEYDEAPIQTEPGNEFRFMFKFFRANLRAVRRATSVRPLSSAARKGPTLV
jgi:hypothetical protein